MRVANDTLIPSGSTSLGADWTSEALSIESIYILSIQLVFTGSPNGAFTLEISDDMQSPTNWTEIRGSSQTVSAAGDHTWNLQEIGWKWLRVKWARTSGSGTLTVARYNGKGV